MTNRAIKARHTVSPKKSVGLRLVQKSSASPKKVYLDGLAASGRKAMCSLLNKVEQIIIHEFGVRNVVWYKLNYEHIQRAKVIMIGLGLSFQSINLALAGVRGVIKTAFNMGLIDGESMMRIAAVKKVSGVALPKGRSLSHEEIEAMCKVCDRRGRRGKRDKTILLVGCYAGLRCAELTALMVRDFDQQSGVLSVMYGKGNKCRQICVAPHVVKAMQAWIRCLPDKQRPMFPRMYKGNAIGRTRMTEFGLATVLKELQNRTGIAPFTTHDLRRSFITTLLEKNIDLNVVRKLAGHAEISVTARYDRRGDSVLRKASSMINCIA